MPKNKLAEEILLEQFNDLSEDFSFVGSKVDSTLNEILKNIPAFNCELNLEISPSHRVKTQNSFIKKAFYRLEKNYEDPLSEITDKIGTRIVVTSLKEQEAVKEVLMNPTEYWDVIKVKDLNNFIIEPEKFNYCAVHFLLRIKSLSCFGRKLKGDLCYYTVEVQLKTLLQHAWAQINHDTTYKGPFKYDNKLIRIMSKTMALMEVTDENFDNAYAHMMKDDSYEKSFLNGLLQISKEELGIEFKPDEVDILLTKNIFELTEIEKRDLELIKLDIVNNKKELTRAFLSIKSYLRYQPVVILLFYLIRNRLGYLLKDNWIYENDVLRELYYSMGYSFQDS